VIGPATRVIPESYAAALELVSVDASFYGFQIAAPLHEWPFYHPETGWHPTAVWALTDPVAIAAIDFRRPVAPTIAAAVHFAVRVDDVANAVRLTGRAYLAPGISLGATNAVNGDKVLRLDPPWPVAAEQRIEAQVRYQIGGGLGSFRITPVGGGAR
jgi:hypothetical protein